MTQLMGPKDDAGEDPTRLGISKVPQAIPRQHCDQ